MTINKRSSVLSDHLCCRRVLVALSFVRYQRASKMILYSVNSPQTWENNESGNFSPAILKPLYIYKKYMVDIDQFHTQMAGVKWILHLKQFLTIFMSCTHLKDAPMVLFFLEKQILTSPSHSYRETRKNY